jgi:hypothetical protein
LWPHTSTVERKKNQIKSNVKIDCSSVIAWIFIAHQLSLNQPLVVCDETAVALKSLNRNDIFISESTWFYDGGGCC